MGMIVTLYLISANVYNSVDAPKNRGFSYVEIWMVGSQFPILIALLQYGFVLYLKKVVEISDQNEMKIFEAKIKKLDLSTMIFSLCSFMIFASIYCIVALSSAWFINPELYGDSIHLQFYVLLHSNKLKINFDWLNVYKVTKEASDL